MKIIILIFLLFFLIGISEWLLSINKSFLMDENTGNGDQVDNFAKGKYEIVDTLTMPPTYHLIVGSIARTFNLKNVIWYRLINLFLVIWIIPTFYYLCEKNILRTLQFSIFPIMFPFYILVYTDLFSLLMILLSFLLLTKKRYYLSAFTGTIAMFTRQDNIIWILFFCSYIFFIEKKDYFRKIYGYIMSIILILSYLILYRGKLVLGDNIQHPIMFHHNNIWFFLFVFFLIFFPIIITHLKEIKNYLIIYKDYIAILLIIMIFVFINFTNRHFYNQEKGFWFNEILLLANNNIIFKIIFVLIIATSIAYLLTVRFKSLKEYLIYPFSIIFLSISLLIEPRYYFITFSFFMIFRKEEKKEIEKFLLIYYSIISIFFFLRLLFFDKF